MSDSKHTPGPYSFRIYATDDEPAALRAHGIEPVRMLTNEGQVAIMAPDPDQGTKRIALVDCQTEFKRGTGHKTDCAERDANARLFTAADDMLAALQGVAPTDFHDHPRDFASEWHAVIAAIAKATTPQSAG